jgi:adenylate cyclase
LTCCHIGADQPATQFLDEGLGGLISLRRVFDRVGAIEPKLRLSEIERASRKLTGSAGAYDLYLRALAQFHAWTPEGHLEATRLSLRALELDFSYSPAAALVGWCRVIQRSHGWAALSEADRDEAVRLARRAIETGRDDPDAIWMAGQVVVFFAGEHAAAASAIDRALALNPNSAHAWMVGGWVQCMLNKPDSAIDSLRRGLRLSPLDPLGWMFKNWLALAHLVAGRYEDAMEWVDQSLREQPRYIHAVRTKVVLCAQLGRITEAHDWLSRVLALQPQLTVTGFRMLAGMRFSPELMGVYVEGLRRAGLPEE